MDYSLETVEEKLMHIQVTLGDLRREAQDKGNVALGYVLEHLYMIVGNAAMELRSEVKGPLKANGGK